MKPLLIATNNQGKLIEIQLLLNDAPVNLFTPSQLGLEIEVDENGQTYEQNAALKGRAFARAARMLTLADDSGLEVDALDGLPGLHSARLASWPGAGDADRRGLLLKRLSGLPRPWTARFRCIVAVVRPDGEVQFAEGACPGEIIPEEHGENGFGYDPIFWLPELKRTMAELSLEEKNQISHRARAVKAALPIIAKLLDV
jgi:XTP/dITP diphosphohydrolase